MKKVHTFEVRVWALEDVERDTVRDWLVGMLDDYEYPEGVERAELMLPESEVDS